MSSSFAWVDPAAKTAAAPKQVESRNLRIENLPAKRARITESTTTAAGRSPVWREKLPAESQRCEARAPRSWDERQHSRCAEVLATENDTTKLMLVCSPSQSKPLPLRLAASSQPRRTRVIGACSLCSQCREASPSAKIPISASPYVPDDLSSVRAGAIDTAGHGFRSS